MDPNEACGEPGLPLCPQGEQCVSCHCEVIQCGNIPCARDPRCQIPYCRDASGNCVWDDPELINPDPAELKPEQYGEGTLEVPECCVSISYKLFVKFNPCTGRPIDSTYQVDIVSTAHTGGSQCVCGQTESTAGSLQKRLVSVTGEMIGCDEAVDTAGAVYVTQIPGEVPPRIRVECVNCCGNPRVTEKTLPRAQPRPPVNCGELTCPPGN